MDVATAIEILGKVTYRPGWLVEAKPISTGLKFLCGTEEPDAYHKGEGEPPLREIVYTWAITSGELKHMDRDGLLRWALDIIMRRVQHEVEEWVKFDGVRIVQPHPGRGKSILGPGVTTPT